MISLSIEREDWNRGENDLKIKEANLRMLNINSVGIECKK